MAALANGKESKLRKVMRGTLGEAFGVLFSMVNFAEENDVQSAIESVKKECNNPKDAQELDKFKQIADLTEKVLDEKANKQFEILETGKDADGYNKIPNQLNIEATVSEEVAKDNLQPKRKKGGKQRTFVDED